MKKAILLLCLSSASLYATENTRSAKEPPFDADLFKRDAQVFSLHGEFLYWRVQEGCLDYALVMQNSAWGPTLNYAQGKFKTQTWNGSPGFRVAASFFRAPKSWEIKGEYTRLVAKGNVHANKPESPNEYLTGTWPQILPTLSSAKSKSELKYNIFDLLVDRFFNPNPHLRLRLIGGGTVAWMDQSWTIDYFDAASYRTTTNNKWSFTGGGLKFGAMVDWYWGMRDFYMVMKILTAGVIGEYHNSSKQTTTYPQADSNINIPFKNAHYNDVRPAYTFQFQIGPSWQKNYPKNRIEIFAGYELNGWLNLLEIYRSSSGTPQQPKETYMNSGMIALQGLTTRLTVDF